MTILPEPAHLKKAEYEKFLRAYPQAAAILAESYTSGEGEEIPLVKEPGGEVLVYVGLLSETQKDVLGPDALRELQQRFLKPDRHWGLPASVAVTIIVVIGAVVFMRYGGFHIFTTPTAIPSPTAPPESTVTPEPPTPIPTSVPTSEPAATVTPLPTATSLPTSTPPPTPLPTATPSPTAAPSPILIPSIGKVIFRDQEGFIILAGANETYRVKPGKKISLHTEIADSSSEAVEVEYSAIRGDVQRTGSANATYIAPDIPESKDLITLKIVDVRTKKILDQYVCTIQTLKR